MPKVSVIIPTYNRAALVAEAVRSVLAQTFTDFDVIVVDDGSTDRTREIITRFGPPVRYIWQANAREGAARNRGVHESRSEFVSFLDSDDTWFPQKLERDVAALAARPAAALVYSNVEYACAEGRSLGRRSERSPSGWVLPDLARRNFVVVSTVTVRREQFHNAGGFSEDPSLSGSVDWEAWVRVAAAHEFVYMPEVGARIRVHSDRMMANPDYMAGAILAALRKFEKNPRVRACLGSSMPRVCACAFHHIAINYYAVEQYARAWGWLFRALRTDWRILAEPRFLGTCIRASIGRKALAPLRSAVSVLGKRDLHRNDHVGSL